MIDLPYSLVIEATSDPDFFGFYSPELEGFTGVGRSVKDCLSKARRGFRQHTALLAEQRLPIPQTNPKPMIKVKGEGTEP
jgi:predicted RNase H-like HicB family nuclease